jgi:hypothetical protein
MSDRARPRGIKARCASYAWHWLTASRPRVFPLAAYLEGVEQALQRDPDATRRSWRRQGREA